MDWLDKLQAYQDEARQSLDCGSAVLRDGTEKTRSDVPFYPITIIGCIRGVDGWYQAGFDEMKKTIIPMKMIERRSINFNEDCPMCAHSDPKTNHCMNVPINGGTPCVYYSPKTEQEKP